MTGPSKIKVLYFDVTAGSLERFADLYGCGERIRIVGAFGDFKKIEPLFEEDDFRFVNLLEPDVAVIRIERPDPDIGAMLRRFRERCHIKLAGLLSPKCARDAALGAAFDYITEETGADSLLSEQDVYTRLFYQIKSARLAGSVEKAGVKGKWAVLPLPPKNERRRKFDIIAVGASAGGTEALTTILSELPADLPPILVVQHIPENFSEFFAKNLASRIIPKVSLASDGEPLVDGTVYLAGSNRHLALAKNRVGGYCARLVGGEKISGHRPSVDALFRSVAETAKDQAVGVILTGMGSDGAKGLLEMREAGAYTIGQDRATCAVYGMPMAAYNLGAVSKQLPLGSIARAIVTAVSQDPEEDKG